jgi:hypothetical protein
MARFRCQCLVIKINESTDRSFLIIFRVENLGDGTARFYRIQPGP